MTAFIAQNFVPLMFVGLFCFLLTGIHATEEAGQHLALMVAGLFWCSIGSLVLCGRQLFARRGTVCPDGGGAVPAAV